ncbi:MAG: ATP-binding protein [Sulfurimonas sp.]
MSIISKPFYYGGVVKKHHFCNRVKEIKELQDDMDAGLNILLYAPRRFGKTSLVLKSVKSTKYKYIFLDFMSIVDEEEFINEYFNAITKSFDTTTDKVIKFVKDVLKIRPNVHVEFDINGMPTFGLNFKHSESKSILKEILDIPYQYALHNNERIIVVFDEFQEIINLNIEDKLRASIQHHGDTVSYIFLGSKKSIMTKLFFDKSKAFYKSVKHLPINKIEDAQWYKYIQKGFSDFDKKIEIKHIDKILSISNGFPYYTQQIANELFNSTKRKVDDMQVEESIKSILHKEEDLFLNEWNNLSQN